MWPTRSPSSGGWPAILGSEEPAADLLQAADDGDGIHVSAITLVNVWYATHKRTDPITTDQLTALDTVLADPEINIHVLPVTNAVALLAREPAGTSSPTRSTV